MLKAFELLAKFKRLRGTPCDVFGYSGERRTERAQARARQATLQEHWRAPRAAARKQAACAADCQPCEAPPRRSRGSGRS